MSITTHYLGGKQAIKRQRLALLQRIRRNFLLKLISLVTALLLYFYVQQERNPTVSRVFEIPINFVNKPADVSYDAEQSQMKVTVSGPQPLMDVPKDTNIGIVADLRALPGDRITTARVALRYDIHLTKEMLSLLSFDPTPLPSVEVQVYPQREKDMSVEAHFPRQARAGYHYGPAIIKPDHVHISGRIDRIKRVAQLVADAQSIEPGGGIDNDFTLSARDSDNNPVEGITIDAPKAHVLVRIVEDPYSKIISVSPIINDQPPPGYRIKQVETEPRQVRAAGRPELIDTISTLQTKEISIHEFTSDRQLSVPLVVPRGVAVSDSTGAPLTMVTVTIVLEKVGASPPGSSGSPTSGSQ